MKPISPQQRSCVRPGLEALAALDAQLAADSVEVVVQATDTVRSEVHDFAVQALTTTLRHEGGDPERAEAILAAIDDIEEA